MAAAGLDAAVPLAGLYRDIARLTPLYTATGSLLYDTSEYKRRELQSILRVDPITDAVLDCDIRHPSFRNQTERAPGLVDCLRGQTSLAGVIRKDSATGMDSIPSGKSEANALGLLMSATMVRLLQTLR